MFLEAQLNAIGGYEFSDAVSTAGTDGKKLLINEGFWNSLNPLEKQFLLDHEMMHITCNHHERIEDFNLNKLNSNDPFSGFTSDPLKDNIAADLSTNSILYDQYVGDQDPIKVIPKLWEIGVFPSMYGFKSGLTYESYRVMLNQIGGVAMRQPMYTITMDVASNAAREFIKAAKEKIDSCGYSSGSPEFDRAHNEVAVLIKKSFASLMKDLFGNTSTMQKMQLEERWGYNKRMPWSALPSERMSEVFNGAVRKNKIGLFLDFSGSCKKLAPVFVKLASLIPARNYLITYHKFADFCEKINGPHGNTRSIGFGTCFESIRPYVNGMDQIWIFTDGQGHLDNSNGQLKNVVWFLDNNQRSFAHLPQDHRYEFLSDYAEAKVK